MRIFVRLAAGLLVASVALGGAGCGLLSSEDEEPLPGTYESTVFRVQTSEGRVDLEDAGATFQMTLTDTGQIRAGRLEVPAEIEGTHCENTTFSGTYDRKGRRVMLDFDGHSFEEDCFDAGTPLAEVPWVFYERNASLGADAEGYVLLMEKVREPENE